MTRRFVSFSILSLAVALIAAGIISSGSPVTAAAADNGAGEVIPGRYIVVLEDGVSPADVARDHGLAPSHTYSAALNGFAGRASAAQASALAADPRVKSVEPDRVARTTDQTLPTGLDRIDADLNPTAAIGGDGGDVNIDVAVIDTGTDSDHPDLNVAGGVAYLPHYWFIWIISCGNSGSWEDGHGHGSHTAGTIAARDNDIGVVGVAPGARIWAVKVLGDNGSGCVSDIVKGIDWVTCTRTKAGGCPQSAKDANDIEVANISLGWRGNSPAARTAIQNSVAAGVFYAVSAGNSATDVYGSDGVFGNGDEFEPASYPEVATISAMADSDGQPGGLGTDTSYGKDDSFASFSNFSGSVVAGNPVISPGKAIDLILPGVAILSTWKDGTYNTISGTSMSSPHAAGLAALHIAANGAPTNAASVYAVRQALIDQGMDQASGNRLAYPGTEPDSNPENLGWAASAPVDAGNASPTANDAAASGDEDTVIAWTPSVSDPEADPLTCSIVSQPSNGSAGVAPDCSSGTYTPDPDYNGGDTFTYKANDGNSNSNIATITLTVNPVNDAPVAVDDSASTAKDTSVMIDVPTNDTDVDGDALSVTGASDPPSGSVTVNVDNTTTYTPDPGFLGTDTFTYDISDGNGGVDTATVTVTIGETSTSVSVSSVTYDTKGPHLLATVTLVDNLGNPVSGASVDISLINTTTGQFWGGTDGTTANDGTETWRLRKAPSGCYTTIVTLVVADGLTWDSATPPNEFCK